MFWEKEWSISLINDIKNNRSNKIEEFSSKMVLSDLVEEGRTEQKNNRVNRYRGLMQGNSWSLLKIAIVERTV